MAPPAHAAVRFPGFAVIGWDGPGCIVPVFQDLACNKKVLMYATSKAGTSRVDSIRLDMHLLPLVSTNRIKITLERKDSNGVNAGSGTFEVRPQKGGMGGRKWSSPTLRPPKTGRDVPGSLCMTVYEAKSPGTRATDFEFKQTSCVTISP